LTPQEDQKAAIACEWEQRRERKVRALLFFTTFFTAAYEPWQCVRKF
jgi:hypothetical protein